MKEFDKYKDFDPVKIPVCEGVMGEVIRGKKKKYVFKGHDPDRRDVDRALHCKGERQGHVFEHLRRAALRRRACLWFELAAGPGSHVHIPPGECTLSLRSIISVRSNRPARDPRSYAPSTHPPPRRHGPSAGGTSTTHSTQSILRPPSRSSRECYPRSKCCSLPATRT